MAFCTNCGTQFAQGVHFCGNCGAPLQGSAQQQYAQADVPPMYASSTLVDEPSTALKVISFFMPIVGLVLFLCFRNDQPISAKAYGKMALISYIIGNVLAVLYVIAIFAFIGTNALSGSFVFDLVLPILSV